MSRATRPGPERRLRLVFLADPNSIHTRRWLGFFADRGHEVHLLVPSGDEMHESPSPGVHVRRFLAWPRIPIRGAPRLVTSLSLRLALLRLRPDVLHAHFLERYGWAAALSGFGPYVVTVWGSDVFVGPTKSRSARVWARRTLAGAALVTAVSEDLARGAVDLGARPEFVRIIQFGFDPDLFSPGPAPADLRAELGLDGRRVVLSPRGLRPIYRHEIVVRAMAGLPDDAVLLLLDYGPDPDYAAMIRGLVIELGLEDRVRLVPPVEHDRMPDLYRLADVVVSMPRTDAFAVTTMEAMACGTPVVLGDLPSAREGLGAVDPDAIVPADDRAAVTAAIEGRLRLSPDARRELGGRLRAAAVERGDATRNLLEMERLYLALADGRPLTRDADAG
jgi:L-malate glycosyltransferase